MDVKCRIVFDTSQFTTQLAAVQQSISGVSGKLNTMEQASSSVAAVTNRAETATKKFNDTLKNTGEQAKLASVNIKSLTMFIASQAIGLAGSALQAYGSDRQQEIGEYFTAAAQGAVSFAGALAGLGPVGAGVGAILGTVTGVVGKFFSNVTKSKEEAAKLKNELLAIKDSYSTAYRSDQHIDSVSGIDSRRTSYKDKLYGIQEIAIRNGFFSAQQRTEIKEINSALEHLDGLRQRLVKRDGKDLNTQLSNFREEIAKSAERNKWQKEFNGAGSVSEQQAIKDKRIAELQASVNDLEEAFDNAYKTHNLERQKSLLEDLKELESYLEHVKELDLDVDKTKKTAHALSHTTSQPMTDAMTRIGALIGSNASSNAANASAQAQLEETQKGTRKLTDIHTLLSRHSWTNTVAWA